jgi:hypothetical protein
VPIWATQFSALWAALQKVDTLQISEFKRNDEALLDYLGSIDPSLEKYHQWVDVKSLDTGRVRPIDETVCVGMPGNKRIQIERLIAQLPSAREQESWVEWCAGKGYLGRGIASLTGQHVTSLEWQSSLVKAGQSYSDSHSLDMQFYQQDVFDSNSTTLHVHGHNHCVALHACGDLHVELIRLASQRLPKSVSIAPCCYHLIRGDHYVPLSRVGKNTDLKLDRPALRVPLQQTVTGGARVSRHRQQEMSFRLGFDELLRAELSFNEQTTVPSIKKSLLDEGFQHFCEWAANKKSFELPCDVDFDYYLEKGTQRFWHMERLSLAQQLFQRPLEMWLALDKCLYLEEKGYEVKLTEFCSREVTPRNLLIQAEYPQ